ncbi:hypothetical protein [Halorubrum laminariae]|uniref:t-SNARE coiled-coil homology domain-containing protein n=1 Tax=Halorubrum laminariae TaxID=1433523 RepID=A0ABD6BXK8_9EURY|nr:hypothetical protein [Halorubrum laminariae]
MSDSRDPDEADPIDVDTFQEWLHYTAESRDLEERELLDRLVSAYWVLDEMSDVVPDTPASGPGPAAELDSDGSSEWRSLPNRRRTDESTERTSESRPRDERAAGVSSDAADAERHPAEESAARSGAPAGDDEPETAGESSDPGGSGRSGGDGDDTDASDIPTDDPVATEIQELRNSIQTQLDLVQTVTELRRQVSDLSLDVEQQRSRQDGFTDRITDDLTRLNRRVEQLDAQVGDDAEDLTERLDAIEQVLGDLESTQDEFEAWIDGEFDEIEALFQRLIERTDDLDDRLVDAERTADTTEEIATARRTLGALRREAIDLGVDEGTCDHCGSSVDLSMLTDPICPGCDRPFADITPGRWWSPLSTATLHTESGTQNTGPTDGATHPRDIVDRN